MKLFLKLLLVAAVLVGGYYVYISRFSQSQEFNLLDQLKTLIARQKSEEPPSGKNSKPQDAVGETSTPSETTHLSTANFKIQKCVTHDGRVIYVDHVKAGQCKNLTEETKTLTVSHTEKSAPDTAQAQSTPSER